MIKNLVVDTNKVADKSLAFWGEIFAMSYNKNITIEEVIQAMKDHLSKKEKVNSTRDIKNIE